MNTAMRRDDGPWQLIGERGESGDQELRRADRLTRRPARLCRRRASTRIVKRILVIASVGHQAEVFRLVA